MGVHRRAVSLPLHEGALLPRVRLEAFDGGPDLDVRAAGSPLVLALLHRPPCDACAAWAGALLEALEELGRWDARLVLVSPPGDAGDLPRVTEDAARARYTDRTGVLTTHAPATVVADAWGEVYLAAHAGSRHEWPDVRDVVATARYVSLQCPECSVAEGVWRGAETR